MKKEHLAFLVGGFAFGILFGYALFRAVEHRPQDPHANLAPPPAAAAGPAGPSAPGQGGAAPMVAEINALKVRVQENPHDVPAMLRLGDLYREVGMWDQADAWFDRALETHPDDAGLIRRLANLNHDAQRWQRAIDLYERTLQMTPDDPNVITDMGICFKGLGRFDRALELFEQANGIDPDHWQSLFNTVVVTGFDLGRYDDAERALERLERVKPDAPDLGRLREELHRHRASAAAAGP